MPKEKGTKKRLDLLLENLADPQAAGGLFRFCFSRFPGRRRPDPLFLRSGRQVREQAGVAADGEVVIDSLFKSALQGFGAVAVEGDDVVDAMDASVQAVFEQAQRLIEEQSPFMERVRERLKEAGESSEEEVTA